MLLFVIMICTCNLYTSFCRLVEKFVMEGTVAMVFGTPRDSHSKEKKIFVECGKELWGAIDETTLTNLWFTLGRI